jgi:hypothetical protein
MLTHSKSAWLPIVVVAQLGCFRPLDAPDPPPLPRSFVTAGPLLPPASCEFAEEDDACTQCQKDSCCNEIAGCTGQCKTWFAGYQSCLHPDGAWSGFSTKECMNEMGGGPNAATLALVDCFSAQCSGDRWCGTEPRAVFSFPPPSPTVDFSAAEFLENYCNGCHTPGKVGPTGEPISQFTSNALWTGPLQDENWLLSMDYATVASKKDIIACGVRADYLPGECSTLTSVRTGFFTKPAKFPPSGIGGYASCPYIDPTTGGCPQPTPFERARLLSWIAEGAPR